jgi:hypothetical protein
MIVAKDIKQKIGSASKGLLDKQKVGLFQNSAI